jgi:hypothetical protein
MEKSTVSRSSKSGSISFSSSAGGDGGVKKLKKESTCRALRTSRVRLVSDGR